MKEYLILKPEDAVYYPDPDKVSDELSYLTPEGKYYTYLSGDPVTSKISKESGSSFLFKTKTFVEAIDGNIISHTPISTLVYNYKLNVRPTADDNVLIDLIVKAQEKHNKDVLTHNKAEEKAKYEHNTYLKRIAAALEEISSKLK